MFTHAGMTGPLILKSLLDIPAKLLPSPRLINLCAESGAGQPSCVVRELSTGLLTPAANIAPKYFYNALGSKLFEAITGLDEYYPTRTEAGIVKARQSQIVSAIVRAGIQSPCLIDLGAGNCAKAAVLIPHLMPRQYVPVDISVDFLRRATDRLQASFPTLDIVGLGMDFSSGLALPDAVQSHDRVFFYPGSSVGNFDPDEALCFLSHLVSPVQGNARGLLIGVDMVKDSVTLEAAYDDALGVTAAFNKNLLLNVNTLLHTDFDLRQWRHVALFNVEQSRIEMHLEATCGLTVRWPGHDRSFSAGERIHTESSYKYTPQTMTALLHQAGFAHVEHWTDDKGWFGVFWAAV